MKFSEIPSTFYVLVAFLVLAGLYAMTREAAILNLLEITVGGLLGIAVGGRAGTSLIQTGANAQVATDDKKRD